MKNIILLVLLTLSVIACKHEHSEKAHHEKTHHHDSKDKDHHKAADHKSMAKLKQELTDKGFQIFDYMDEKTKDTVLMQQYFIAFLKSGPNRSQNEEEAKQLQAAHLAHLGRMYEEGYADISGPFGDDGEIRGITIYNVPTQTMADSLANMDPMVKAGRLVIETHPWWAAKGFPLR